MSIKNINNVNNNSSVPIQPSEDQSGFLDPNIASEFSNLDLRKKQVRDDQQLELILNQAQEQAHKALLDAQNQALFGKGQRAIESGFGSEQDGLGIRDNNDPFNPPPPPPPFPGQDDAPIQSPFIEAAKALLKAVLALMVSGAGNSNPFSNIAKLLAGKSMIETVKTLAEAGMTEEVVEGNSMLKHEALDVDTKAAGLRGLFETAIQYWNQVAQADKQIEKDTQQLAQRA